VWAATFPVGAAHPFAVSALRVLRIATAN